MNDGQRKQTTEYYMNNSENYLQRRRFLKVMAASGLCPLLAPMARAAEVAGVLTNGSPTANDLVAEPVPRRKLGKTGVSIPCLAVGGVRKKEVMDRALHFGFTHWDTAASYSGSEKAIGEYLSANKGVREKLFISTKPADIATPLPIVADMQKQLEQSLQDLKTDYIDLYLGVHAMRSPNQLTDELRQFAETAKKKGQIRFFGFSNHANTTDNLAAAAKLEWIDALLVAFNYRMMARPNPKFTEALEACHKANIGMIAIKTQGFGAKSLSEEEKKLTDHFTAKGFEEAQAKIKLVLEDKRFASASVGMSTVDIVNSCAGAALDRIKLSQLDRELLAQHAHATCDSYCAGCANVCGATLPAEFPLVSDIMRFMMYHENYGEPERARELFSQIPVELRQRLLAADYGPAESRCPQHMPIGSLVAEACRKLA